MQLFILKKRRRTFAWKSCIVKTKSKGNKNIVALSTFRPLHGKTIDDGKQQTQILKFYDFTKGGTDTVDQSNDYSTTRSKSCRWVMLLVDETVAKLEKDVNYTWPIATQRHTWTMPQNQLNSVSHVVSVFAGNNQCKFAMVAYNEILFIFHIHDVYLFVYDIVWLYFILS